MMQQDNAVLVDLPEAETSILPQEQLKQLTVSVSRQGTFYVGTEIVDDEKLRRLITEARKDWGEETEIRIRSDKNVLYGVVKPILRIAAESGIRRISFAVTAHSS